MIAPHLISESIPPLHIEDSGDQALLVMLEYNVSQLPVTDGELYAGLVTREDVLHMKPLSEPLKNFSSSFRQPFVKSTAHLFDMIKAAIEFNVRIIPVVNEEQKYLGLVSAESCLRAFAVLNSLKEAGGILELEIAAKNYSLSELAGIVEEQQSEILCLYTNINHAEQKVEVTIKLNTTEVAALIAAFERYEYEVKAVHNDTEYTADLKERYDSFMRYLKV